MGLGKEIEKKKVAMTYSERLGQNEINLAEKICSGFRNSEELRKLIA